MKQWNKHTLSILLMSSSIALLVVFQVFWLKKVYEEQRTWLQKEADNIFRDALMELQDSLLQRNISHSAITKEDVVGFPLVPIMPKHSQTDTFIYISNNEAHIKIPAPKKRLQPLASDSIISSFSFTLNKSDSIKSFRSNRMNPMMRIASAFPMRPENIRSVQVNRMLQRVIMSVKDTNGKEVIIRINNDSISTDSVKWVFTKKLQAAHLPIPFVLNKISLQNLENQPWKKQLIVGPIPSDMKMPPQAFFIAELLEYQRYLFQKIFPQLLFSIFLISITFLSFWLIYRSLRQQQRLAIIKNDFISNITHELKTPIATVSVAIEALNNFNALQNPQLTKEYLDISKNELDRLTILVDKVLKMAIFEQAAPELRFETFNFSEMVHQVINSMKLQFEKYNAKVNFQPVEDDFMISGDRIHLTSVVYNLLDNALKYSKELPAINVRLERQNRQLHLFVQDNGIGIPAEYRNRIFEKFFRVPTGDVHNVKGYGLGLNYVASVVKQHGGSIEVASEARQGSTFTVHLPKIN